MKLFVWNFLLREERINDKLVDVEAFISEFEFSVYVDDPFKQKGPLRIFNFCLHFLQIIRRTNFVDFFLLQQVLENSLAKLRKRLGVIVLKLVPFNHYLAVYCLQFSASFSESLLYNFSMVIRVISADFFLLLHLHFLIIHWVKLDRLHLLKGHLAMCFFHLGLCWSWSCFVFFVCNWWDLDFGNLLVDWLCNFSESFSCGIHKIGCIIAALGLDV